MFRSVEPGDRPATRGIVECAFATEAEALFLDELRTSSFLLGEWLAEDSGEAIAHIAFTRVSIATTDGALVHAAQLAPLAVIPDRQRQGFGTRLTAHALQELEARGEALFFVVGHPEFYARFGFRTVQPGEIDSPWTGKPAFMVRGTDVPRGRVVLPSVIANAP